MPKLNLTDTQKSSLTMALVPLGFLLVQRGMTELEGSVTRAAKELVRLERAIAARRRELRALGEPVPWTEEPDEPLAVVLPAPCPVCGAIVEGGDNRCHLHDPADVAGPGGQCIAPGCRDAAAPGRWSCLTHDDRPLPAGDVTAGQ